MAYRITGAVFDVDGVLLDSMYIWKDLGVRYLKSLGLEAEEGLSDKLFAMSLEEGSLYLSRNYALNKSAEEVSADIQKLIEGFYFHEVKAKEGAEEILEFLRSRGIPMAIATSSPKDHVEKALHRNGLLKYFTSIFTTTMVGESKHSPLVYNMAAKSIDSQPQNTLVVEDSLYALKTAEKADYRTVGVLDIYGEPNQRGLKAISEIYVTKASDFTEQFHKLYKENNMKTALTIAGSDSGGGAGIQADIKTMISNGVFATSAITALTAQNTTGVRSVLNSTPEFLADQLDAVFTDIYPDAVKIGMVSDKDLIKTIASKLKEYKAVNIVVDPVMVATSGSRLISEDAVETLMSELFPLASVLTPNIPEAEVLTGLKIADADDMIAAAKQISEKYDCAVLCKGGHAINDANDLLYWNGEYKWFKGKRINNPNTHGTGCTLSSAIASNLAKGFDLEESVQRAKEYISQALAAMLDLGKGSGPMNHGFAIDNYFTEEKEDQ